MIIVIFWEVESQRVGLWLSQITYRTVTGSNHVFSAHSEVRAPEGSHGTSASRACVPWQGTYFRSCPSHSLLFLLPLLLPTSPIFQD